MTKLLDQYGNPIPSGVIASQSNAKMGPDMIGYRSAIQYQNTLNGFTPEIVSSLLINASQGSSLAWQEFCVLLEQRDLHYLGVLTTRKRAVSQLPITVQDAGDTPLQKKQAEFVRNWLKKDVLRHSLFDILDAIAKGYCVHEIQWHCEIGNYYPEKLIYRPQRWFEISYQDGETIFLRSVSDKSGAVKDVEGSIPEISLENLNDNIAFVHRHPSWSGLTIDSGLSRAVAFNSLFKLFTNRDWGVFAQAFGMPIRVGKYDSSATQDDRDKLFRAVTDAAGLLGCMIPEKMNLEFIEARKGASGDSVYEARCKYLDEQTSKAVLGQTGTTDSHTGTQAAAQTHRLVQEDIERSDALLLSASVNDQLVRKMIDFSFGAPKDGLYPILTIGRPDEAPLETVIDAIKNLGPQGFKVKADDLYSRLNLEPPEEDDPTVGIVAQAQNVQPAQIKPPQEQPASVTPSKVPAPTNKDVSPPLPDKEKSAHSADPEYAVDNPASPLGSNVRLSNALAKAEQPAMNALIKSLHSVVDQAENMEDLRNKLKEFRLPEEDFEEFREEMQAGMMASLLSGMFSAEETSQHDK